MSEEIDRLRAHMDGRLDALEARLQDVLTTAIRDAETRILKAVYGYTQTIQTRVDGFSRTWPK